MKDRNKNKTEEAVENGMEWMEWNGYLYSAVLYIVTRDKKCDKKTGLNAVLDDGVKWYITW